jgi:CheY-like chemotaxis protein
MSLPGVARAARVLVVDDNHTYRDILRELLLGWGFVPTAVDTSATALAAVQDAEQSQQPFEVLLIDAAMPDMDGFALAHELQRRGCKATGIMMLTTVGRRGGRASDRESHIATYLTKPIKQDDLLQAIVRSLGADLAGTQATLVPGRAALHEPRRQALRVLLAEDNVINQRLMVRLLEKSGHEVTLVRTGGAALDAIAKTSAPFDIGLMDVQMPEMDGFEATAAIRARERATGGHLPLVALTAHAMRGDRERCLKAGFDGYVSKPIHFQDLFDTIDQLVSPPGDGKALPAVTTTPRAAETVPAFAEAAALESTGGDPALLRELISVFLGEVPGWMRDLDQAIQRGHADEVQRLAHTIKGAVDSCGASRAYDAAMLLERMGRDGELGEGQAAYATLSRELGRVRPELVAYLDRKEQA